MAASGEWFYCLEHRRVEPREGCREADRMGPYPTPEAAANWQQRVDERNATWDEQDDEEE